MKRKVAFQTLGCKLNFAETSAIARSFSGERYERVSPESKADVYVINGCTVTETADRKCRQAVRKIINSNPGAFVAVVGCWAQLRREEIAAIPGVDLILGTEEKFDVAAYIDRLERRETPEIYACKGVETEQLRTPEIHACERVETEQFRAAWSAGDRTRTFLKVQDGCDNRCSYCTVPLARGRSRNPGISQVVEEAAQIVASGVREIVLTGVNVGDFGKSTGETLEQLLRALVRIEGLERLRLSSIEPDLLTNAIIDLVAEERMIMPHIHMPLQSGSDRMLGLMRRRYRSELFRDRVMAIREKIPGAGIGADVIVGFPGETEGDFEDTLHLLEELPFSYLHVFAFSPRPGTPAAEMSDFVARTVKEQRSRQLIRLSESHRMLFMQNASGTLHEVLFEKKSADGMVAGLTGNYIRVVTPYRSGLPGTVRRVKLTAVRDDASMYGELVGTEE